MGEKFFISTWSNSESVMGAFADVTRAGGDALAEKLAKYRSKVMPESENDVLILPTVITRSEIVLQELIEIVKWQGTNPKFFAAPLCDQSYVSERTQRIEFVAGKSFR